MFLGNMGEMFRDARFPFLTRPKYLLIKAFMASVGLFYGCTAISQDSRPQAIVEEPPAIVLEQAPEFQIETLRLGEHYVSYKVSIYSDGTVEFLGRPDKPEDQGVGVGKHYAHIPLVDFKGLSSVLKREGKAAWEKTRIISERYSEVIRKARTQEEKLAGIKETTALINSKIAPKIARDEQPIMTLEKFYIGDFYPSDRIEIYADGAMHFDNSLYRAEGHQYSQIGQAELTALQRAFESIQPAIIPLTPAITKREHPTIAIEQLTVGDFTVRYKVEVYSDGTVHFFGEPGGKYGAIGDHYSKIGLDELQALLVEFKSTPRPGDGEKTDFFDLSDDYESGGYDGPRYAISLEINGRYKRISFVGQLADLQENIERAVNLDQWISLSHSSSY